MTETQLAHCDDCLCGCREFEYHATQCPTTWRDRTGTFSCTRQLLHDSNHQQSNVRRHACAHLIQKRHAQLGFLLCALCGCVVEDPSEGISA